MRKLLIDIGNTLTKIAVFEGNSKIHLQQLNTFSINDLVKIKSTFPDISGAIFSSTKQVPDFLPLYLNQEIPYYLELNHTLPLPVQVAYKTPETLGKDRVAGVAGAYFLYPDENVLVIDMGTAITYDILTSKGIYLGGNISPGLNIRFKSLNYFTDKLPLLSSKDNFPELGNDTENAIIAGVQKGIIYEIEGYINHFERKYKSLKVVLTGGDSIFFAKKLKSSIFAEADLLFYGLNKILEYNILIDSNE